MFACYVYLLRMSYTYDYNQATISWCLIVHYFLLFMNCQKDKLPALQT